MTDLSPPPPPFEPLPAAKEPMFRVPPATGWLIAVNVLIQIVRGFLSPEQDSIVEDYLAFHSSSLHQHFDALSLTSLVTYQFLHGGWYHLAPNMIFLLAFGAGVERPIGKVRFLALYFVSGIAGALVEAAFTSAESDDLMVGASASTSGVFGAAIIIWNMYRMGNRPLGLLRMAALLIAMMAVTGILGVGAPQGTPVAWIAHIGGFIAGIAFGFAFKPRTERF